MVISMERALTILIHHALCCPSADFVGCKTTTTSRSSHSQMLHRFLRGHSRCPKAF